MVKLKAKKPALMTSAAGPSLGVTLFMAREVYDPTDYTNYEVTRSE